MIRGETFRHCNLFGKAERRRGDCTFRLRFIVLHWFCTGLDRCCTGGGLGKMCKWFERKTSCTFLYFSVLKNGCWNFNRESTQINANEHEQGDAGTDGILSWFTKGNKGNKGARLTLMLRCVVHLCSVIGVARLVIVLVTRQGFLKKYSPYIVERGNRFLTGRRLCLWVRFESWQTGRSAPTGRWLDVVG
jgi:hypothetical protein